MTVTALVFLPPGENNYMPSGMPPGGIIIITIWDSTWGIIIICHLGFYLGRNNYMPPGGNPRCREAAKIGTGKIPDVENRPRPRSWYGF
jgi:hypothetical protein